MSDESYEYISESESSERVASDSEDIGNQNCTNGCQNSGAICESFSNDLRSMRDSQIKMKGTEFTSTHGSFAVEPLLDKLKVANKNSAEALDSLLPCTHCLPPPVPPCPLPPTPPLTPRSDSQCDAGKRLQASQSNLIQQYMRATERARSAAVACEASTSERGRSSYNSSQATPCCNTNSCSKTSSCAEDRC